MCADRYLLIVDVQMLWLVPGRGVLSGSGSSRVPPEHMIRMEVAWDCSWSLGGQSGQLETAPEVQGAAATRDCSWSSCRQCLAALELVRVERL